MMFGIYDMYEREHIRKVYEEHSSALSEGIRLSPYDLGFEWKFTPIEFNVWGAIRYLALPLYPQYPVGPFFLDFGDPKLKIGIEVDSVKYHADKVKDLTRQRKIEAYGWHVFRIPSRMTYREKMDFEDEDGILNPKFFEESAEGYLMKIYEGYTPNYYTRIV